MRIGMKFAGLSLIYIRSVCVLSTWTSAYSMRARKIVSYSYIYISYSSSEDQYRRALVSPSSCYYIVCVIHATKHRYSYHS